jgi:predicted ATP-grasp superfamily ATP-dependent carboligase
VTALDAFADLDQHASVHGLSIRTDLGGTVSPRSLARAARNLECDAVAYVSSFENDPKAVDMLAAGRALLGNPAGVLRRVRDPRLVTRALLQRGCAAPGVQVFPAAIEDEPAERQWLVKPLASGGGRGVRLWHRATPLPRGCYLQELIDGTPGSVVFVSAGGRAVPLGISRQLVGEDVFGASGYQYCGSILVPAGDAQFARDQVLSDGACLLAGAVAEAFRVVGVNGLDFVAREGVPYAVEVNPRWSASMELVERAYGLSVFGVHAAACSEGALPEFDLSRARRGAGAVGKAVVFARRDVEIRDTRPWLGDTSVRDVPHPGERISSGRPVCTVFATGGDVAECHAALVRRAEHVYEELAAWQVSVA